jgi:hypothetical protein
LRISLDAWFVENLADSADKSRRDFEGDSVVSRSWRREATKPA